MLKSVFSGVLVCISLLFAPLASWADETRATPEEAIAMVKKGIAHIQKVGPAKAYPELSNTRGTFTRGDLYLVVWTMDGLVLAQGQNNAMIGKNLIDLKDIDGRPFIRERLEMAKTQKSFWQEYQFSNPLTKKIEPKRTYCERLDDTVVCGGVYKNQS